MARYAGHFLALEFRAEIRCLLFHLFDKLKTSDTARETGIVLNMVYSQKLAAGAEDSEQRHGDQSRIKKGGARFRACAPRCLLIALSFLALPLVALLTHRSPATLVDQLNTSVVGDALLAAPVLRAGERGHLVGDAED